VPLTPFQHEVLATLAQNRTDERYLAGGAALHFTPNSLRYSNHLDFFHDAVERVATSFAADAALLRDAGYQLDIEVSQPGFIRAIVARNTDSTRIDWAHDSAWRFLPLVRDPLGGLLLHPIDLGVNKMLALAGRDEARDFFDALHLHRSVLPLGALCWAAVGKDPGFTPLSLVELLKRRGRPRGEDVARLHLAGPYDPVAAKAEWTEALEEAERFVRNRPPDEAGCLYWSAAGDRFVMPAPDEHVAVHFGTLGGVLPRVQE